MSQSNTLCVFLLIIVVSSFSIPLVRADEDLMRDASNISVVVPSQGNAMIGTSESMRQYNNWLIECSFQMLSLFNQISDLFGITNMEYTKKMQETLRTGINLTNSSNYPSHNPVKI